MLTGRFLSDVAGACLLIVAAWCSGYGSGATCYVSIGYKNIPVSIDDAPKAVQGERNVVTTISARSAQRI